MKTKLFVLLALAICISFSTFAATPEQLSYQAVIKDASNNLVVSHAIRLKISILQTTSTGTVVYSETHAPTSNTNGLVSVAIGTGTVVSGTFASINWSTGTYFIKSEIDPGGGTSYSVTGTSQLQSVPYALHAKTVDGLTTALDLKVDKVSGKGLSTNDYTTAEQTKLAGIATGAQVNVKPDWNAASGNAAEILNKPTIANTQWTTTGSNIYYNTGNVGIGTTTPTAKLDVSTSGEALRLIGNSNYLTFYNTANTVRTAYIQQNAGTNLDISTNGLPLILNQNGGNVGIGTSTPIRLLSLSGSQSVIRLYNSGTTTWTGLEMFAKNGTLLANIGLDDASGRYGINMKSDGTEDFTITQNGKVGIGTTTPSQKLDVAGNIKITNQGGPVVTPDKIDLGTSYSNGATNDKLKIYLYDDGSLEKYGIGIGGTGDIQYHTNGRHDFYVGNAKYFSVTTTGGANTSDRRLKRDILPLNNYGLKQVMQLNPVSYIYKADSANTHQIGFIAQEVQQIIPEVVTGKEGDLSKGESLGIVYGNLVPVLTKAIQEQQTEITDLKKQIEELKSMLIELKNK